MGFFDKEAFDQQAEEVAEGMERATFEWEGRFIAHITNSSLRTCEKPGANKGSTQYMAQLTIDKVLEAQGKNLTLKADSKVLIFEKSQGYISGVVTKLLSGFFQCGPKDISHDMANQFVDKEVHIVTAMGHAIPYEGVPCFFDRIREHYTGSDDQPKSYVPEGLTRPLTLAEVEEHGIEISEEVRKTLTLFEA